MAALKLIREPGKEFDLSVFHGKYCTFTMNGQDIGYAQVGIVSSGRDYVLFQFHGKRGLMAKQYVKYVTEVKMSPRKLKKETPLVTQEWDEDVNPFCYFVGERVDIHMHQTRLFEATPGFFGAKILFVDTANNLMRIKENSRQFNVQLNMVVGIMECESEQQKQESAYNIPADYL